MTHKPLDKNPSGVIFLGNNGSDQVFESVTNLVFDSGNTRLGINTSNPQYTLDVSGNLAANKIYEQSSYGNIANSGTIPTSITLDLDESNFHFATITGATTISLTNQDVGQRFIIRLEQGGAGSNTVTWFSNIKWPDGVEPTLSTGVGEADLIGFLVTSGTYFYDGFLMVEGLQ